MASFPDIIKSGRVWVDLVAENPALAHEAVTVQNKGEQTLTVFEGGSSPPADDNGALLFYGSTINVKSDHIWVHSTGRWLRVALPRTL